MVSSIAERLTNHFVTNGIIKDEDREIYYYGLRQGFLIILNIITTIIIGYIFKMIWQTVLFMGAYIPLRTNGGGYHAKTEVKCYLFSVVMILVALLGIKFIPMNNFVILGLIGFGGICIWYLAPVEDANKPLDNLEEKIYKKRTRIILMVETVVILLTILLNFSEVALVMSIAVLSLAFMLILGTKTKGVKGN